MPDPAPPCHAGVTTAASAAAAIVPGSGIDGEAEGAHELAPALVPASTAAAVGAAAVPSGGDGEDGEGAHELSPLQDPAGTGKVEGIGEGRCAGVMDVASTGSGDGEEGSGAVHAQVPLGQILGTAPDAGFVGCAVEEGRAGEEERAAGAGAAAGGGDVELMAAAKGVALTASSERLGSYFSPNHVHLNFNSVAIKPNLAISLWPATAEVAVNAY